MKIIKIGLLGLGTVGRGVYKIITNEKHWNIKIGAELKIEKILVRDIHKDRGMKIPEDLLTTDIDEIVLNEDIDLVVELIGGIEQAKYGILAAFRNGKNVVTANKDLLALHGEEVLKNAEEFDREIKFEASVAGGIPIIHALKESLIGNNIKKVMGIFNGTTNFIFTKMEMEGYSYEKALKEAQELGFAEANPESDVEGLDAARKTAILASIAFNSRVNVNDVYVEGITKVKDIDFMYAKEMGYTIKLLGITRENNGEIEARVHPTFIPLSHPMASIKNENNAVFVSGDSVGEAMFYGKGAGELPTASSVVGDIAMIVRSMKNACKPSHQCSCYFDKKIKSFEEVENKFYARLVVENRPGVLSEIASIFGHNLVSISEVIQKRVQNKWADLVIITDVVKEKDVHKSFNEIGQLSCVSKIDSLIRVES